MLFDYAVHSFCWSHNSELIHVGAKGSRPSEARWSLAMSITIPMSTTTVQQKAVRYYYHDYITSIHETTNVYKVTKAFLQNTGGCWMAKRCQKVVRGKLTLSSQIPRED